MLQFSDGTSLWPFSCATVVHTRLSLWFTQFTLSAAKRFYHKSANRAALIDGLDGCTPWCHLNCGSPNLLVVLLFGRQVIPLALPSFPTQLTGDHPESTFLFINVVCVRAVAPTALFENYSNQADMHFRSLK